MESVNGKVVKNTGVLPKANEEGRPVAVDWALSKEKWEETQKPAKGDVEEAASSNSGTGSPSADDSDEDDSASATGGSDENADMTEDDERLNDDTMVEDEPVKPQLPAVNVGSTLFIRNLPFETTEQELNTL